MSIKTLFKPAWQSKSILKAEKAIRKLKKQDTIYRAALYHYNCNYLFTILFDRLNQPELLENSALKFLENKFVSNDLMDTEWKECAMVMGKLFDHKLLVKVLSNLDVEHIKNQPTSFFYDVLDKIDFKGNLIPNISQQAQNIHLRNWTLLMLHPNEIPDTFFESNLQFLEYFINRFPNNELYINYLGKFPVKIQKKLLHSEAGGNKKMQLAIQGNPAAVSLLNLSEIKDIYTQRKGGNRNDLFQKIKRTSNAVKIDQIACELFDITQDTNDKSKCYELMTPKSRKRYNKQMEAAKKKMQKANYLNSINERGEKIRQTKNIDERIKLLNYLRTDTEKNKAATQKYEELKKAHDKEIAQLIEKKGNAYAEIIKLFDKFIDHDFAYTVKENQFLKIVASNESTEMKMKMLHQLPTYKLINNQKLKTAAASIFSSDLSKFNKITLIPYLQSDIVHIIYNSMQSQDDKLKIIRNTTKSLKNELWKKFHEQYPDWAAQEAKRKEEQQKEDELYDKLNDAYDKML